MYVARFSRWRHALSWCANHQTHAQRNHLHHQLGYIHSRLLRLSMTLHQTENTSTDATPGHTWTMNPWPPFHARSKRARGRSGCVHRKEINLQGSSMLRSGSWVPSVKTSSICMRAIWMFFFSFGCFCKYKTPQVTSVVYKNTATTLFGCEASAMFCGLTNLTQLFIDTLFSFLGKLFLQ